MPKYGIHSIVLQEASQRLAASSDSSARSAGVLLSRPANKVFAELGAIGPDLMFYAPDYPMMPPPILLLRAVEALERIYEQTLGPLVELKEEIDAQIDALIDAIPCTTVQRYRDLIEATERAGQLRSEMLRECVKAVAVAASLDTDLPLTQVFRTVFQRTFEPELAENYEELDWFWMDQLHYRRTGAFAATLVRKAVESGDHQLQAYAWGYLTHVAADTVGHAFVNQICGGPYRLSVQRHTTAESYMDAWEYRVARGREVAFCLYDDLGLEAMPTLPDKLGQLLQDAMIECWRDEVHPSRRQSGDLPQAQAGFLSGGDIAGAYLFMRRTIETIGRERDHRPPEPFEGADEMLADLLGQLGQAVPDAPPGPGAPTPGSPPPGGLDDWVAAVQNQMNWLAQAGGALLGVGQGLLQAGAPNCFELPAAAVDTSLQALRLVVYGYELTLYRIYRLARSVLVANGTGYPLSDELDDGFARNLMTPAQCGVHPAKRSFPHMRRDGQSHLTCPSCRVEAPTTVAGFHARDALPSSFIRDEPFDEAALVEYASAATPADTRALQDGGRRIGNAVDLAAWMIARAARHPAEPTPEVVYADWNLDADRGYGAKCWQGLVPHCRPGMEVLVAEYPGTYLTAVQGERYLDRKHTSDLFINDLVVREYTRPDGPGISRSFLNLSRKPRAADWAGLLAPRLEPVVGPRLGNTYFVNGVYTMAFDAWFSAERTQGFFRDLLPIAQQGDVAVRLLHNRHEAGLFEEERIPDIAEATADKSWAYSVVDTSGWDSSPGRIELNAPVANATTIAVVALLHRAWALDVPVLLVGYSQGSLITTNGLLAFASLGQGQREYLGRAVRLLLLGFPVSGRIVARVGALLAAGAVRCYANPGDPVATWLGNPPEPGDDLLTVLAAQDPQEHRLRRYFETMDQDRDALVQFLLA